MKKRAVTIFLALIMVCSLLPLNVMAETETTISRAEWLHKLVEAFSMTVDDETAPDNYFSDIASTDAYYRDVLIAEEFGVIDIPAGSEFRPDDNTTREFAAATLNYCLGFQLNDGDEYSFSESESVEHPDDIQIAINRGWFALEDGNFLPEKAIDASELEIMMADVAAVLGKEEIDSNYDNSFTFAVDTIEIPDGTDVSLEGEQVIITDCPQEITVGDCFVVYSNNLPCAFKADAIIIDGNKTIIDVTAINDDSVITDVDAQGTADADFTQFTPYEGTEIIYIDENTGEEYTDPVAAEYAIQKAALSGTKEIKRSVSCKIEAKISDTLSVSGKFTLKDPKVNYKFDTKTKSVYIALEGKYELSVAAKGDLADTVATKSLDIAYYGVPGIGGVKISMKFELSGSATATYSGYLTVGISGENNDYRPVKNFKADSFSLVLEATLKSGVNVSLGINDVPGDIVQGYVYAEAGAKGKLKRTAYSDDEAPNVCVHTAMYLYLEYGATAKVKFGSFSKELSYKGEVWHDNNSPIRVVHHYEDGIEVAKCTRGNTYDNYFTSTGSNYWGSGWSGANGAWGLDSNGEPVQIYSYSLDDDGNATITGFSGNATALSIPSTLDGHTVVAIGNNAFKNNTQIRSVVLPNGIKAIGDSAFSGCSYLSCIEFPDGLTSIGQSAFQECTSLETVNLPKNVTYIGGYAFGYCSSLKSISIPKSLTSVGDMGGQSGMTIPYGGPFAYCSNLQEARIEEGMTSLPECLFFRCTGLKTISIPDTVTTIGQSAFQECTSLETVNLPKNVTYIGGYAFGYCSSLKSISIPKSLTSAGDSTSNFGKLYIPYGGPFAYCSNLQEARIEEGMTSLPECLFFRCTGLKTISIPDTVTTVGQSAFQECTSLEGIEIPDSVTNMGPKTFQNCTSLKSVKLPKSRKNIMSYMFSGCTALESITLPDTVETIQSYAFQNCTSLKSIILPDNVTAIQNYAFQSCSSLIEITWGKSVSTLGEGAFNNCDSITELEIPSSVTTIGGSAFYGCDGLTKITIPDSVTSIGASVFYACDALKDVHLGTGITAIPKSAFEHCDVLESLVVPYRVTSIGENAFKDCVEFKEITIPRSVANIVSTAFSYPDKLTIYGVAGTYAETFANENDIKFVDRQVNATAATLDKAEIQLNKGGSDKLNLTVTPADFTDEVNWKSADTSVATITDDGTVKAVGVGSTTIKVTVGNVSASCKVTVVQPVTSISLNKTSLSLETFDTYQLTATANPSNAYDKNIVWSSSDTSVATVSETGLVTAVGKGTANITAAATAVDGVSKTCAVTVTNNGVIAQSVEQLESPHNYSNNCSDIWIYSLPNASAITVTFDTRTNIEDGFDYLYIYDANGNQVGKYTGTELAGKSIDIDGNSVKIKLVSDSGGNEWGFKVVSVVDNSTGHTHSYTAKITKPTCTAQGYTTHTCACGDSYKDSYVDALGHDFGEWTVTTAPTCTEKGVETRYCSRCDASEMREVKVTGHNYKDGVCTRCGAKDPDYKPPVVKENPFVDVSESSVYYDAILWAYYHEPQQITGGYTATEFRPGNPCTRGQVVTFLWRAAGCPEPMGDTSMFNDASSIAAPYQKAVAWAVEKGITTGYNDGTFRPNDSVTRAQFVTFLWRYEGKPATSGSIAGFTDAASISGPYQQAVAWAVEKGITTGYNDGTFRPNATCTRWAVVLFMYRDMK